MADILKVRSAWARIRMTKVLRTVVNGHGKKVVGAVGIGAIGLLLFEWIGRDVWADIHKAVSDVPVLRQEVKGHEALPIHPGGATLLHDLREDFNKALLVVAEGQKQQREDFREWRDLSAERWNKQDAKNDAMVQALFDIRDKLSAKP